MAGAGAEELTRLEAAADTRFETIRLVLTGRALENPIHGQCGACREPRRLQQLVVLGTDELAVCRACYEAAARFSRLSGGHPILFDLEHLP